MVEEKRIKLINKITGKQKDWVKIKNDSIDWLTNGEQCQWEYFIDQLSNELVLRRY